jgi:hypothetical protein
MTDEDEIDVAGADDGQGLLPLIQAASIQGRVALGPDAGARISRLGSSPPPGAGKAIDRLFPPKRSRIDFKGDCHPSASVPAHDLEGGWRRGPLKCQYLNPAKPDTVA